MHQIRLVFLIEFSVPGTDDMHRASSGPLKVCHLIDHMGLGGAQRTLIDFAEARSPRIAASVISLRESALSENVEALHQCGADYRSLNLSKVNPLGVRHIRQAIAQGGFDVVHAHLDYSNSLGIGAALSVGPRRPALISHIHSDPWQQNSPMFRAAILAIAPRVDAHVVPGDSLRRRVSSLLGNRAARIAMIPPGVDVLRFDAKRRDQEQVDGLRRGAKRVVGFVGRLARQKSIETLLASATTLLAAEPSTRILIVGDGPRRKLLESECRRLGIADAVTFVGYVGAVWHCYQAMDVLTLVSQYEGFGIVTLEAMAMKVPVVATAVTGVSDAITDRENGLLVPFDDPATLAGTILELFDDERLRRKLESGGLATVRAHSREAMAAAAEALYADLAGAKDVP